ncbi:MAG: DUF3943 domain-containing protein [Bacteroidia bacterium]|nr:DUF3943 domain-containing protein [Bacteroidia bacterium]
MRTVCFIALLLLSSTFLFAQVPAKHDTIVPGKGSRGKQLEQIKEKKIALHSDKSGAGNEPKKSALIDTTFQNKYGDLLDDDPEYNKKYSIMHVTLGAMGGLLSTQLFDRFVLKADYARVGIDSWKNNIKYGWEWDNDRFGVNFVGHPYSGALSFSSARSNGYNYFASYCFAAGGSLMWEYFGETTRPSYNDIINTSISGAFLGEVLYRLSSNVLDDRTRGGDRVFREIAAGLIDPMRGINRLIQGKTFRITNKEVYEKEPLNISIYAGLHRINDEKNGPFGNGTNNVMFNAQFDYGNPFEIRKRKPFDFFRLRADLNFGVGRKLLDNVTGYGILFGKNSQLGKLAILAGGFQYYDYWDNSTFELGAIGFGGGVFSKLPISTTSNLYTNIHLAIIPLAGNSTEIVTDTATVRDYNFGGGLQAKFESTLNLGKYADLSLIYYNYLIHTYQGAPGTNFIQIIKPRITIQIHHALRVGFENYIYINDQYLRNYPTLHSMRTEQKIFLLLYFEDRQRKGQYN